MFARFLSLLSITVLLSACSVGMAMSGKENPDLGAVRVGASRGEIQLHLGTPVNTVTHKDGSRTDIYEYEIGNAPSAGRAIGHGVMDVLTLGIWEVVGTPIEAVQGDKYQATIKYDKQDKVVDVTSQKLKPECNLLDQSYSA